MGLKCCKESMGDTKIERGDRMYGAKTKLWAINKVIST